MEAVLVRKLRQALASQEPLTEEHVVSLLVTIRKLLQHTGQQQTYFALNFHCSWAVHAVMDQGKGPARILHRLDGVYDVLKDTMLHDLERSLYNELHATTVWETFRTDLKAFLTAYSLPTTIVQGDWTQFLCHYAAVIDGCPLRLKGSASKLHHITHVTVHLDHAQEEHVVQGQRYHLFRIRWVSHGKNNKQGTISTYYSIP